MPPPASPRHVLMTADAVGGVWTYALDLARELGRRGVAVSLATMGALPSPAQREEARQAGVQLYESAWKLEWMTEPWDDVAAAGDWLLDLEERLRPDVVHLNGYAHGSLPWQEPRLVVGHSCVLSWWQAVHGCAAPAEYDRYREEVARGLHAADCVLAPSQAMLDALHHHYGPLPSAGVIPNGRDDSQFAPGPKEPFILGVGRLWDAAKNTQALAAVAPRLSWPVCLAGDERHPDGSSPEHNGASLLGRLTAEQLADWYARAAIFALPALYEPFGLSAVEAALAGCALVLGDIPSLREVWGDAALFVPLRDPEALHATLARLIDDAPLRAALAAKARAHAMRFTPGRMADGYQRIYGRLLRRGRLPCAS